MACLAHVLYYTNYDKIDNDQHLRKSKYDIPVPDFITERGQRRPDYPTAVIWNSLTDTVRAVGRMGAFQVA